MAYPQDLSPWKRMHPREDDQRPIMAQVVFGQDSEFIHSPGDLLRAHGVLPDHPWPTFEPRVRMDIQTAVQMSGRLQSYSAHPVVEMLCGTNPIEPAAHDWPVPVSVDIANRYYRDKLRNKARMARQEAILFPTKHRRQTDREILRREVIERRILRVLAWVAIACVAGALVCLALLVRRMVQ